MKKIAFITESVYPYFVGGQEKRIYDYSNFLTLHNHFRVSVVSMKHWDDTTMMKNDVKYVDICPKLPIYKKDGKRNIFSSIRFGFATFFYVFKSDDDILDIDVFPYFPLIFARCAVFFKKKKPIIIGYWAEYWGKKYWKKYYGFFWWAGVILEKISFWSCDEIVANSHFTQNKLQKAFGKNKKKIISIPPASIDIERIDTIQSQKKIYDIIYYGRIIAHKHVEHIVDTVEALVNNDYDARALIIGGGPDEEMIKSKIISKNLSKNINLIDFVDDYEDLIKYIKSAKIMIQPSEREGFGITVVEANACGLPVFVIDYPDNATKELIENDVNGFVFSSIDEMTKHIQIVFQNKKQDIILDKLSKQSIRSAQKYSKATINDKILSYYKNL